MSHICWVPLSPTIWWHLREVIPGRARGGAPKVGGQVFRAGRGDVGERHCQGRGDEAPRQGGVVAQREGYACSGKEGGAGMDSGTGHVQVTTEHTSAGQTNIGRLHSPDTAHHHML